MVGAAIDFFGQPLKTEGKGTGAGESIARKWGGRREKVGSGYWGGKKNSLGAPVRAE